MSINFNLNTRFTQLLFQSLFFFRKTSCMCIYGIYSIFVIIFWKHLYLLNLDWFRFRLDTQFIWHLIVNLQTFRIRISGICIRFSIVTLLIYPCSFSWFLLGIVCMMYLDWIQLYNLFRLNGFFEMKIGNLSVSVGLSLRKNWFWHFFPSATQFEGFS